MLVIELEDTARKEIEGEKINLAKKVLKSRIVEIEQAEKVLDRLKEQYMSLLNKSIDDVCEASKYENTCFHG